MLKVFSFNIRIWRQNPASIKLDTDNDAEELSNLIFDNLIKVNTKTLRYFYGK